MEGNDSECNGGESADAIEADCRDGLGGGPGDGGRARGGGEEGGGEREGTKEGGGRS